MATVDIQPHGHLQSFDFNAQHRKGHNNAVSDSLSCGYGKPGTSVSLIADSFWSILNDWVKVWQEQISPTLTTLRDKAKKLSFGSFE